ncbi:MAG TPA: hypothetical protein VEJ20_05880, partial [Candidatus Eremiobacteraceae bacterium]|nr:hypothetical protein [Candidatus Eremiobacteraceae bacterium]
MKSITIRSTFAALAVLAAAALTCATAKASPFHALRLGSPPSNAQKWFTVNLKPGTSKADLNLVADYYRQYGLDVHASVENELLFVHGTYGEAAAAGHTSFGYYKLRQTFVSLDQPEAYPPEIGSHIIATTMNDGPWAQNAALYLRPSITVAPAGGYTPANIATYYDINPIYSAGVKGAGTNVAILTCGTILPADISEFETENGLPANTAKIVSVDGGATTTELESTGDTERVIGTAPNTTVTLFVGPDPCDLGNLADLAAAALADESSKKFSSLSSSWGSTEDEYEGAPSDLSAEDTDLKGIMNDSTGSFICSFDNGAFAAFGNELYNGEITVWYPSSDPYVLGAGGTDASSVSASNTTRTVELAWGESGGGVSTEFAIPSWQKGIKNIYSTTKRNVPDVALDASCGT